MKKERQRVIILYKKKKHTNIKLFRLQISSLWKCNFLQKKNGRISKEIGFVGIVNH